MYDTYVMVCTLSIIVLKIKKKQLDLSYIEQGKCVLIRNDFFHASLKIHSKGIIKDVIKKVVIQIF